MSNANEYIKDMTARYVYAATRYMPGKQRKDAKLELESLISDMLEERSIGRPLTEKDIDVVLTELGKPSAFFSKESGEERYLIGPELYPLFSQILKIVLAAQTGGLAVAALVLTFLGELEGFGILWFYLPSLASGVFVSAGAITLFFAIAERFGGKLKANLVHQPWNLSNLPTVPQNKEIISRWESIANIIFIIVAMIIFVFFSRYLGAVVTLSVDGGRTLIPVFNESMLAAALPFILVSMVLGLARECFCLVEGRYTMRLAIVTLSANVLSLVCWGIALAVYPFFNPDFSVQILALMPDLEPVSWVFGSFPHMFFAILVFAHLLDCGVSISRAVRYKDNG